MAATSASRSAQIRDTSDLEMPVSRAERLDQVVDLASGDSVQVGLHHHGEQSLVDPSPAFNASGRQLWNSTYRIWPGTPGGSSWPTGTSRWHCQGTPGGGSS